MTEGRMQAGMKLVGIGDIHLRRIDSFTQEYHTGYHHQCSQSDACEGNLTDNAPLLVESETVTNRCNVVDTEHQWIQYRSRYELQTLIKQVELGQTESKETCNN